jgi:excisionase family DNA binding protein
VVTTTFTCAAAYDALVRAACVGLARSARGGPLIWGDRSPGLGAARLVTLAHGNTADLLERNWRTLCHRGQHTSGRGAELEKWRNARCMSSFGHGKSVEASPRPDSMTQQGQVRPAPLIGPRDELLTIAQAGDYLGTGERFIRRLVAQRRITYVKLGKYVRLQRSILDAFIEAGRVSSE